MAVGTVAIKSGTYYAVDEQGNLRELQDGDTVNEGERVVPAQGQNGGELEVVLDNGEVIQVGNAGITLDQTVINANAADPADTALPQDAAETVVQDVAEQELNAFLQNPAQGETALDQVLANNNEDTLAAAANAGQNTGDTQQQEQQEQEQELLNDTTKARVLYRNAEETNIEAPLREPVTVNYNIDTNLLGGETDTVAPVEEGTFITVRLFALDENGDRVSANSVVEGEPAAYIALAFDQNGNRVEVNETVKITFGSASDSAEGGSVDYVSEPLSVTVGEAFSTDTVDDYLSDDGESFSVQIVSGSASNKGGYDSVTTDTSPVRTMITDDTGTPNIPGDGEENDHETVTVKLVALDENGDPILDGNGEYTFANGVGEGKDANYMALAFSSDAAEFKPSTVLAAQEGTVVLQFSDNEAHGAPSQNALNGDEDYQNTQLTVNIGEVVAVAAYDDYLKEGDETYDVSIVDGSYDNAGGGYENVTIDGSAVTTTISDAAADEPDGTTGAEDTVYVRLGNDVTVQEGDNVFLTHRVDLVDKNGDAVELANGETLTIKLDYTDLAGISGVDNPADFAAALRKTLTITGDGSDSYTFSNEVKADSIDEGNEAYAVRITDIVSHSGYFENMQIDTANNGATATIQENIDPQEDTASVFEGDGAITTTSQGNTNLLDNDAETGENPRITGFDYTDESGQSRHADTTGGSATADTRYGSLTINSDGTWSYTPDAQEDHSGGNLLDAINVTIEDDNGNSVDTDFTITVKDTKPTATPLNGSVDEDDLGTGSDGVKEPLSVTKTLGISRSQDDISDTVFTADTITALQNENLTSGGNALVYSLDATKHTLTAKAGGDTVFSVTINDPADTDGQNQTYTFTLAASIEHPNASGQNGYDLPFFFDVKDSDSTLKDSSFTVSVIDDIPRAFDDTSVTVAEGGVNATISHNLLDNDTPGADQTTEISSFAFEGTRYTVASGGSKEVTGSSGTLKVYADGTWEFTSAQSVDNSAGAVQTSFDYTITDRDGDSSVATQPIVITDGADPTIDPVDQSVDESDLGTGSTLVPVSVGETLDVVQGSDDIADTKFKANQSDLEALGLRSGGTELVYSISDHDIIAKKGSGGAEVFRIAITDPDSVNAAYEFTLSLPLDHTQPANDTSWDLPFDVYTVDSDGDSAAGAFSVTVNDSVPEADDGSVSVKEDAYETIRLTRDAFEDGKITLNNTQDGDQTVAKNGTVDIYDADGDDIVGSLKNNGDGTVTFTPTGDYSGDTSGFSYSVTDEDGDSAAATVNISVVPASDRPSVENGGGQTIEDTAVAINLKAPQVSDDTDKNGATSQDAPELLGLIRLDNMASGVRILDGSDNPLWTSGGKGSDLYILLSDGEHTQDAIDGFSGDSNHLSMTTAQFEALKVDPVAQSHKDIDIKMHVTEYEVDDSGYMLDNSEVSGNNGSTRNKTFHVEVEAVTDDISLAFDDSSDGTISTTDSANDTFTHDTLTEGADRIDLTSLLSAVAGGSGDVGDASERRWYDLEGLPKGSTVTLGTNSALVDSSGTVTLPFSDRSDADPSFTLTLPEQYSGDVSATLTLRVKDYDSDSSSKWKSEKSETVYLNLDVESLADVATLAIKQPKGLEDAGRSAGNSDNGAAAGVIDEPQNGIPVDITVTSSDTDGSEYFNVTVDAIPEGASMYVYDTDGVQWVLVDKDSGDSGNVSVTDNGNGTWQITMDRYDNEYPPKFIPIHNDNGDYTLKVSAQTVDTDGSVTDTADSAELDVLVKVIGIADIPVNDTRNFLDRDGNSSGSDDIYALVLHEETGGNTIALEDIYAAAGLDSYDNVTNGGNVASEQLSVVLTGLDEAFSVSGGGASFLGGSGSDRKWIVDKDAVDDVTIKTAAHFSGEIDLSVRYVTTENDGDSKTHSQQSAKILVTPVAPETASSINTQTGVLEDTLTRVDLSLQNDDGGEAIENVWIKQADVDGKEFTLYLDGAATTPLSTLATTTVGGSDYYELDAAQANSLYVLYDSDLGSSADTQFDLKFSTADTLSGLSDGNGDMVDRSGMIDATYTLNLSPVTDGISIDATAQNAANVSINADSVTINDTGSFDVAVDFTPLQSDNGDADLDGSESVTKLVIENVPAGVTVEDATLGVSPSGISFWFLDITDESLDGSGDGYTLTFNVVDEMGASGDSDTVTITAYDQDGNAAAATASTTLEFIDNIAYTGSGPGSSDAVEANLNLKNYEVIEDTQFSLAEVISVTPDANDGAGDNSHDGAIYSVVLKSLQQVSLVDTSAVTVYSENGETLYLVSGTKDQIDSKLASVKLLADTNFNENNDGGNELALDATLTAYMPDSSLRNSATQHFTDTEVTPVTDEINTSVDVTTDAPGGSDTLEDGTYALAINLSSVDDPHFTYVQNSGGGAVSTITFTHVSGIGGTLAWEGGSVVLSQSGTTSAEVPFDKLGTLTFSPAQNASGSVSLSYDVYTQEDGASNVAKGTGSVSFNVTPVADGFDFTGIEANGAEYTDGNANAFTQITVSGSTLDSLSLQDDDGSENMATLFIDDLPDGFLVYTGDAGSRTMAQNAGENGSVETFDLNGEAVAYNTWNIDISGGLPKLWIKAPEDWSGSVENIKLVSYVEDGGSLQRVETSFTLAVSAVASSVTVEPTQTFEDAYEWTPLNLNANMTDLDGSESLSIELSAKSGEEALDDTVLFRLSDGRFLHADFDPATGTYGIEGIDYDQINNLEMLYHDYEGVLEIAAKTVEGSNGDESSWATGEFTLRLDPSTTIDLSAENRDLEITGTSEDDTITTGGGDDTIHFQKGDTVDGGSGSDSLLLDSGLDFGNIGDGEIEHIEKLDLNDDGDQDLTLSARDVLDITDDAAEVLTIEGENGDTVALTGGSGDWSSSSNGGYTSYSADVGGDTITVKIDDDISVTTPS